MAGATTGTLAELLKHRYPKRSRSPLAPRRGSYDLAPGLSRREAQRQAAKRHGQDYRGFSYDRRTGRATLV